MTPPITTTNSDTKKLTKDDVREMFKNHLKKEFEYSYKQKKYEHYWLYDDDVSSSNLEEILKLANEEKIKNFTQAANYYISTKYPGIEEDDIDFIISDFYDVNFVKADEIKEALDYENYPFLSEIFYENMEYDLDVETVLKHSIPDDLTIYFGKTWDDEHSYIEYEFVQMFDKPEFLTNDRNTPIDWLMKTQGYTRKDLISEEKRKNSVFLTTLYKELFDYRIGLEGHQLIAIPYSNDFKAILNLSRNKNVKINKSTEFGFFDRIHGSGCNLSIKLEKDIIIDKDSPIYEVTMDYHNSKWNYSPDSVFGISRKRRGNDLEVIKTEKEK